jgi:hypothetical protein
MKNNIKKIIAMALAAVTTISAVSTVFAEPTAENINAYTGAEITPDVSVRSGGAALVKGTDYELTYENNINVGTATVTVTFKGNYTGERTVNFNIVARTLSASDVAVAEIEKQICTGGEIKPEPVITYGDVTLEKDKDYTLTYENNTDVGTGKVNITFIGNYTGTASAEFEIAAKELAKDDVSFVKIDTQTYTGGEIKPEPTITYGDITLEKDKDYALSYENNTDVGTGKVIVNFIGKYTGTASTEFEITAKEVTESNITISPISDQIYTGKEIKPEPVITDTSK